MIISLKYIIEKYKLNITGVLHIGAHYGQEYLQYRNQGVKNMMFFEPIKSNYEGLMNTLLQFTPPDEVLDGVIAHNIALGNEKGKKEMFVETANQGQSCSILEPGSHLKQYPKIKFDKKEIVEMARLDDISFDRGKYNMINIDVQGYELEVFLGAENTLSSIDIIYTEVNFEDVYKKCCYVEDLDLYLGSFGFVRVLTDAKPKTWGDALYLKYN
jgi:FkbM family methyltransferase